MEEEEDGLWVNKGGSMYMVKGGCRMEGGVKDRRVSIEDGEG